MKSIRQRAIEGLQVGDSFTVSRTFSEQDIQDFARISRDYNPVHVDLPFARLRQFSAIDARGRARAAVTMTDPQGGVVLEAETTGVIPGEAERARLAAMVAEGDPTNRAG